ncbi:MAG: hypothetical protein ABIQ44_15155 [Chloroflexia bacterium]
MRTSTVESRIRTFMLLLSILTLITTLIELWMQDHTKTAAQWIPWILGTIGLVTLIPALLRPTRTTFLILRGAMIVLALGGLFGITIHFKANLEFQQDIHAGAAFGSIIVNVLKGAAPMLAPGTLVFAALLALGALYAHPALTKSRTA